MCLTQYCAVCPGRTTCNAFHIASACPQTESNCTEFARLHLVCVQWVMFCMSASTKDKPCTGTTSLEDESAVDRHVEPGMKQQLQGIKGWRGLNNPWMPEEDQELEFSYINLLENVERYTGYKVITSLHHPQGIMVTTAFGMLQSGCTPTSSSIISPVPCFWHSCRLCSVVSRLLMFNWILFCKMSHFKGYWRVPEGASGIGWTPTSHLGPAVLTAMLSRARWETDVSWKTDLLPPNLRSCISPYHPVFQPDLILICYNVKVCNGFTKLCRKMCWIARSCV